MNRFNQTLLEIKQSRTAPVAVIGDFSNRIYRANGFEAFVVGETTDSWLIEGNGVKCKVWKHTTKNNIVKVSADYKLKSK